MKKIIAITILALASFVAEAQVKLGISVDPHIAWMGSDLKRIEGDGSVGGVAFGLNVDRYFGQNYAVYSGAFIETTGGKLKYREGITLESKDTPSFEVKPNGSVKYRMQYITIPAGLKLRTNPIGYNSFYATLGFKTSFCLRTKGWSDDGDASANIGGQRSMDGEVLKDATNWINFGYQIGVGTEYSLGGGIALIVGLTYNNGIANTLDNSPAHINQNNLSLKLGVMF